MAPRSTLSTSSAAPAANPWLSPSLPVAEEQPAPAQPPPQPLKLNGLCPYSSQKLTAWLDSGGPGEWERFRLDISGKPVRVGDELWFYYAGRTYRHGRHPDSGPGWGAIGLAKLRPDGYISMDGSFDGAYLVTRPVLLKCENLRLNAYAPFGNIVVELLDENGQLLEG